MLILNIREWMHSKNFCSDNKKNIIKKTINSVPTVPGKGHQGIGIAPHLKINLTFLYMASYPFKYTWIIWHQMQQPHPHNTKCSLTLASLPCSINANNIHMRKWHEEISYYILHVSNFTFGIIKKPISL